ncbi:hypothetical protein CR513_02307, partial [Mucuna pruriens]
MDRSMIDAASGGALMDKTPAVARHLISNMTSNTQGAAPSRMVNEIGVVDNLRLENQLTELTSLVRQLVVGQHQPVIAARVYGICTSMEHPIDMCPTLQETESDHLENVGSIVIPTESESRAISTSKIWTWTEHALESKQLSAKSEVPTTTVPTAATIESAATKQLTISRGPNEIGGYKQPRNLNATIQDLKMQVGQLANTVSQLQSAGSGNLPSQTILNSKGNASVVSLRSGRELPQQAAPQQKPRLVDAKSEPEADSPMP